MSLLDCGVASTGFVLTHTGAFNQERVTYCNNFVGTEDTYGTR